MRSAVLLLALVASCETRSAEVAPAPPQWVSPPPPTGWPLGLARGTIGRTVAPQGMLPAAVLPGAPHAAAGVRLERVTPRSAAVLDDTGVRAYIPFAMESAVVTDDAIIGTRGGVTRRFLLPERWRGPLEVSKPLPLAPTAELRDAPPLETVVGAAVEAPPGTGLARIALDGDVLVVGNARFDLHRRAWSTSSAACGDAPAVALCRDGDRAIVRAGGKQLATIISDDGGDVIATALDVDGMALVIAAERGRVVARLPYVEMVPAWSLTVRGVVAAIEPAGDAVLVTLEDGDAYRIDARTGEPTALAGSGVSWRVAGDAFTGVTAGGPVPPDEPLPLPPPPEPRAAPLGDLDTPPRLMTPVAAPPMAPSVQLTLYAHDGSLRARNDYAIPAPASAGLRGAAGAPVVLAGGSELLVLDPVHGDPIRRVRLPDGAVAASAFSTVIDGKPVVGVMADKPVRVVLF